MPCADGSGMQVRYETTNELALVSLSFLFLGLPRVGRAAEQAFEDAALLGRGLGLFFDLVHVFLALAKPKGHFPFQAIAADTQSHGLAGAVLTQPAVRMSRKGKCPLGLASARNTCTRSKKRPSPRPSSAASSKACSAARPTRGSPRNRKESETKASSLVVSYLTCMPLPSAHGMQCLGSSRAALGRAYVSDAERRRILGRKMVHLSFSHFLF